MKFGGHVLGSLAFDLLAVVRQAGRKETPGYAAFLDFSICDRILENQSLDHLWNK